jgi:galactose mutarotase-like enzyme
VTSSVYNKDKKPLPFAIGAHPAFNCPLLAGEKFEDYVIVFEREEDLVRLKMNPDSSFQKERVSEGRKREIPLRRELFAEDALVFEGLKSAWVKLRGPKHSVQVSLKQARWLGIWTKGEAKFLCLEPWQGHGDFSEYEGELSEREGMIMLPPDVSYDFGYEVTIE